MRTRSSAAAAALGCLLSLAACSAQPGSDPRSSDDERQGETQARAEPSPRSSHRDAPGDRGPALDRTPAPPTSPRQAAAQLVAAERAIRDRSTTAERLAAAGHTQQLAYREIATHPAWDRRVPALLPRRLRRDAADNVAAHRSFRSMHADRPAELATELPAWRIVAPPPAAELKRHYLEAQRRYGIDWEYLAAIHLVETRFGRIRGTSVAGAQGPMQFIPTTWDIYGEGDVHDPHDAIMAAARLLRANGFARDRAAALYRYNNHSAYVRGVTLYAEVMQRRPHAFRGYHQWQVHYLTRRGSIWLPEGYAERRAVPVREWLARR